MSLLADMHKNAMPIDSSFSFSFPSIDDAVIWALLLAFSLSSLFFSAASIFKSLLEREENIKKMYSHDFTWILNVLPFDFSCEIVLDSNDSDYGLVRAYTIANKQKYDGLIESSQIEINRLYYGP